MVHIYSEMGLEKGVAVEIVDILSQNKEGFLKIMMIEELQLLAGDENPFTNSIVTFFAFALFGLTSLIPTIIAQSQGALLITHTVFIYTIAVAAFFLGVLGFSKSLVGGLPWYISIPETILVGALAATAAYGMGKAFSG
jgi:vacuolar iron transporter family protein